MKKLGVFIASMLLVAVSFAAVQETSVVRPSYVTITNSIGAGATSVTITNTDVAATWGVVSVYGLGSTSTGVGADTVTVSRATALSPAVFYPVDTLAVSTNNTATIINMDQGPCDVEPSGLLRISRTAASTNQVLSIMVILEPFK